MADDARVPLPGSLSIGRSCFACGPDSPHGLHVPYEQVGGAVEAVFTLGAEFSGAPAFVHGGVVMTVLDEGMAWATIALRHRFAVTTEFTSRFRRPVLVGRQHSLRATCSELAADGRTLQVEGSIHREDGKVCAEATAAYYAMTVEETAASVGLPELPAEMLATFGRAAGTP